MTAKKWARRKRDGFTVALWLRCLILAAKSAS
jgi:hypothetical protein